MKDFQIKDYTVEWDDTKNISNEKKHGISFLTASNVFKDDNRIELYDETHSLVEDRYIVIGMVENILIVIYSMRNESIRIVSARLANKEERKIYYGNNKSYN